MKNFQRLIFGACSGEEAKLDEERNRAKYSRNRYNLVSGTDANWNSKAERQGCKCFEEEGQIGYRNRRSLGLDSNSSQTKPCLELSSTSTDIGGGNSINIRRRRSSVTFMPDCEPQRMSQKYWSIRRSKLASLQSSGKLASSDQGWNRARQKRQEFALGKKLEEHQLCTSDAINRSICKRGHACVSSSRHDSIPREQLTPSTSLCLSSKECRKVQSTCPIHCEQLRNFSEYSEQSVLKRRDHPTPQKDSDCCSITSEIAENNPVSLSTKCDEKSTQILFPRHPVTSCVRNSPLSNPVIDKQVVSDTERGIKDKCHFNTKKNLKVLNSSRQSITPTHKDSSVDHSRTAAPTEEFPQFAFEQHRVSCTSGKHAQANYKYNTAMGSLAIYDSNHRRSSGLSMNQNNEQRIFSRIKSKSAAHNFVTSPTDKELVATHPSTTVVMRSKSEPIIGQNHNHWPNSSSQQETPNSSTCFYTTREGGLVRSELYFEFNSVLADNVRGRTSSISRQNAQFASSSLPKETSKLRGTSQSTAMSTTLTSNSSLSSSAGETDKDENTITYVTGDSTNSRSTNSSREGSVSSNDNGSDNWMLESEPLMVDASTQTVDNPRVWIKETFHRGTAPVHMDIKKKICGCIKVGVINSGIE